MILHKNVSWNMLVHSNMLAVMDSCSHLLVDKVVQVSKGRCIFDENVTRRMHSMVEATCSIVIT